MEIFSNYSFPLILDGGLSNALEAQGCDLNNKLWTASLIESHPEALIQTHLTYLKSGAQIISTASYQATIPGLVDLGYSKKQATDLILQSVQIAETAIKKAIESGSITNRPLIAASIGPYGAYLADGSEYKGNYGVSDDDLIDFHLEKIKLLDNSNADVLAFETIPSYQEALVLSNILKEAKKPAWISFSCKDEAHLNDGSSLKKVALLFANHPKVFAIGVNCTAPQYISEIIQTLKVNVGTKKLIIYPNSGEAYNAKSKTWMGLSDPIFFEKMTKEWVKLGADIIGGCCRIGPEHIAKMKENFHSLD